MAINADELFNALEHFKKYRFPLRRDGKPVKQFLDEIYKEYRIDVLALPYLTYEDKTMIGDFCDGVIVALQCYNESAFQNSYAAFFNAMDQAKGRLWRTYLEDTFSVDPSYYRIRRSTEKDNYSGLDLLHCPFQNRRYASSARFSLAGIPSTYMCTMPNLAWIEAGFPEDYHIARLTVNPKFITKYALLYLDINPLWWCRKLQLDLRNKRDSSEIVQSFIDIARMFPLLLACSIVAENKKVDFKEEYIIPQMLMAWIKQSDDFLGIRYNTSAQYEEAVNYNAHNIVIPTRDIDTDGYCKTLKSIFIDDGSPIIKHVNAAAIFREFDKRIYDIRRFYYRTKYQMQTSKVQLPFEIILNICQTILLNWNALKADYSVTAYTSIQTIMNLNGLLLHTASMYQELYGNHYSEFNVKEDEKYLLTQQIINDVQETLQQFAKIVVPAVSELYSIIYKMNTI